MPQDFRSLRDAAQTIGFHELRQACEISTLRQELERAHKQAEALRAHIEATVEAVRTRVASLTADDLADPATMAPLLQDAVAQLVSIRDAARREPQEPAVTVPPALQEDRPSLLAGPSAPADMTAPPQPHPEPPPLPMAPAGPPLHASTGSWLLPPAAPAVRTTAHRPASGTPAAVDWLRPARR